MNCKYNTTPDQCSCCNYCSKCKKSKDKAYQTHFGSLQKGHISGAKGQGIERRATDRKVDGRNVQ